MRPRTLAVNIMLGVALVYAAIRACRDNPGLAWALAFLVVLIGGMFGYGFWSGRKRASCSGCVVEAMQINSPTGRAYTFVPHSCDSSRWFFVSSDGKVRRQFGATMRAPIPPVVNTGKRRTKKQLTLDKPRKHGTVVHIKEARGR